MKIHSLVVGTALVLILYTSPVYAHFFYNSSSVQPSLPPNRTGAWDAFHKLSGCHAGQKVDGLAKLKKYFKYFGYIGNNSSSNFTDEFDDYLENALKTYQLNFNLNVTGELDEPTVKEIVKPRCGVADVVDGSSSMNSGRRAPKNLHTVAHYTFFPGNPRWPASQTQFTYAFSPENQLTDPVRAVFSRAFQRWSEVTPLTFTETTSYAYADLRIGFFRGDHGDGEPFDGVLGTLAHAFSPPSGRFHLDNDENWVIDGDFTGPAAIDLESVAIHEIGHLLGLGHSSEQDAIMYPTVSTGTRKLQLAADDIQGIQVLYGANPNYNGTTTTTTQERDTSGGARIVGPVWGQISLLAIGLVISFL